MHRTGDCPCTCLVNRVAISKYGLDRSYIQSPDRSRHFVRRVRVSGRKVKDGTLFETNLLRNADRKRRNDGPYLSARAASFRVAATHY